jgi:8-oxo-dGTP pyrophosphatase MutT (NUDIX family)
MTRLFAGVVLVDRRGWLLLQERDEHPVIDPEKWGLPGGHLEPGEEPVAGAVRELLEETGVRLAPADLQPFQVVDVFHEAYQSDDQMHVFAAAVDLADDDIVCGEGRQMVFVEPSAARALDLSATASIAVPGFLDSPLYASMTA